MKLLEKSDLAVVKCGNPVEVSRMMAAMVSTDISGAIEIVDLCNDVKATAHSSTDKQWPHSASFKKYHINLFSFTTRSTSIRLFLASFNAGDLYLPVMQVIYISR